MKATTRPCPGISTAVTTCLLTALSTIGSSRQKQILRFAGALVGGFIFGMGSQIFILPYLDSIAGFTVLFVLVTALASWFMTSSPRLSYFGLQVALVRGVVSLPEFFRDGFTFHISIGLWTRSGVRMPPTANTESQRWPSVYYCAALVSKCTAQRHSPFSFT